MIEDESIFQYKRGLIGIPPCAVLVSDDYERAYSRLPTHRRLLADYITSRFMIGHGLALRQFLAPSYVNNPRSPDVMLERYGIHHLHLHTRPEGQKRGCGQSKECQLLFLSVSFDHQYVLFLNILDHPNGAQWYSRELVA